MNFLIIKFVAFCLLIQLINADDIVDVKYPKNEFTLSNANLTAELKKDIKKDLKKESPIKEQTDNLKLLVKDALKDIKKDSLPQRDNSKATSSKDDKQKLNIRDKEKEATVVNHKEHILKEPTVVNHKDYKEPAISTTDELADLLISTITNGKTGDFRNGSSTSANNAKQSNSTSTLDDLRIKIIEQVHLKAKIFFQALTGNSLLRESSFIKNKNDGFLNSKLSSIYSSTPFLKPFQANARPPTNSNTWCSSLSNSFTQYSQLNAFLVAAFLLFPVVLPFYLLGWVTLFAMRGLFCVGAKQLFNNVIYRIRS